MRTVRTPDWSTAQKMNVTAFDIAQRFIGMEEIPGQKNNPAILAMLTLDQAWPENDEVPWCSGFVNYVAWLLRLPRSKSLMARSWLQVGRPISFGDATHGNDVVILKRGSGNQPGPEVTNAPGHVGFYAGRDGVDIFLLGGNQNDSVSVGRYDSARVLGIRRLA